MPTKAIAVCILNYNGEALLREFLPSFVLHTPADLADIYVIDNCSTDNSEAVVEQFPQITWVQTGENLGFTGGYNRGLQSIEAKYYVIVNSDIEVSNEWLQPMYQLLESDEQIAACQPKIRAQQQQDYFEYAGACGGFIDYMGFPFCRGRIFETIEKDEGQYDEPMEVFWASGACMMIRSALFWESGGFDANFFAHMEEIDLCWRLQRMGYKIYCQPAATVFHVGGKTLSKENPKKTFLNFRNNLGMLYKNTTNASIYWKLPLKMILDFAAALKFWSDNSFAHFKAVIQAHWAFFSDIKSRRVEKKTLKKKVMGETLKIYPRLIAWQYYVKGNKKFSDVCIKESTR